MSLSKCTSTSLFKPHEVGPCFLGAEDRFSSRPLGTLPHWNTLGVKITANNAWEAHSFSVNLQDQLIVIFYLQNKTNCSPSLGLFLSRNLLCS